jgi:hypothetical protein
MKLTEFVGSLITDGIVVLGVKNGEVTDYLVSRAAAKTVINNDDGQLSAQVLSENHRIIDVDGVMPGSILKVDL